ncbi:MAG: hypothetical protein R2787_11345 [Saprospiraceae bacterium]
MKNLHQAITEYSKQLLDSTNDWYNWREINEEKLPGGISLPAGNQYKKNVALKNQLHREWVNADIEKRFALTKYYIADWGGIHTNSPDSLFEYSTKSASYLIKNGKKGIASWSKAIVLHDPNKYAIFDARVAISLNCLQVLNNVENKKIYPILSSRNKIVAAGNKYIRDKASAERWIKADDSMFYKEYLNLLKATAEEINSNVSTIEMLLFAKAEELVQEVIPDYTLPINA